MKELQFTLYEILGYLIPGAVALLGIYLTGAALFEPRLAGLLLAGGTRFYVVMTVSAYLVGHFMQAVANLVFRRFKLDSSALDDVPAELKVGITHRLHARLGQAFPDAALFDVCDAVVVQAGRTDLRDLYIYREGFYRGLTIGLPVLLVGAICGWISWPWSFARPSFACLATLALLLAGAALLSFQRFKRFLRCRVQAAIFGAAGVLARQRPKTPVQPDVYT